jgi:hypothetical protein
MLSNALNIQLIQCLYLPPTKRLPTGITSSEITHCEAGKDRQSMDKVTLGSFRVTTVGVEKQ